MTNVRIACCCTIVCCCIAAGHAFTGQSTPELASIKRIYVKPFTGKPGADKLRDDLIVQLRKLSSVKVVSEESGADAVMNCDGEIWIKGRISLNPRAARSGAEGTPVYSGFLSVEVKDRKGETLWSYLATPSAASEDVAKDLSKRVAKHFADAIQSH